MIFYFALSIGVLILFLVVIGICLFITGIVNNHISVWGRIALSTIGLLFSVGGTELMKWFVGGLHAIV